jgi:UDP-N-acetylmuramoyl-L-alanyl-D-glutamate--2,6-diaminopimelate ligase
VSKALEASPRLLAAQADALVARLPPLAGITSDSRAAAQQIAFAAYRAPRATAAHSSATRSRAARRRCCSRRAASLGCGLARAARRRRGSEARLGSIAAPSTVSPSEALCVVGVTGTNGKTSCSHWIAQALDACGRRAAIMGTLGNGFAGALSPSPNTTPDACRTQQSLAQWRATARRRWRWKSPRTGSTRAVSTASQFDVALFTNLTRDHLDYHGTMAAYGEAKARLLHGRPSHCGDQLGDRVRARA